MEEKSEKKQEEKTEKKQEVKPEKKQEEKLEKKQEEKSEKKLEEKTEKKQEEKSEKKQEEKTEKKQEEKSEKKQEVKPEKKQEEKSEKKQEVKPEKKQEEKSEKKLEEKPEKKQEEKPEKKQEDKSEKKQEEKSEKKQEEQQEKTSNKKPSKVKKWVAHVFFESRKWILHFAVAAVVIGCAAFWFYSQPRFHDLTVELGTESINIEAFMTEFADVRNSGIVTDLSAINISSVGSTPLMLRSGSKNETVTLTVEDTTPPKAEFITHLDKTPDYKPDPYDFVASYEDLSQVDVHFVGNVVVPLNYEDQSFTVVVEDAYGNAVSEVCTLSIVWLKSEYTLELGEQLNKEDLLFNPGRDDHMLRQDDIDAVNNSGIGEYTVTSLVDENVCRVQVVDTTPPELVLTDISVYQGEEVTVDSFVESCFDAAGDVEVYFTTQPDVHNLGIQTITIEAKDINGNITTSTATLAVVKDKTPPAIRGLSTLRVKKRSTPDYLAGVSAVDKVDGVCDVSYDSRGVDLTTAGTYYVTYTSQDKDGNTARVKRTVIVEHDQEDTDALADSIAAGLSSDPEAIRDYVRDTIKYSHNSGGEDPVWYGFTNKSGDCLVHALCLQSLLTRKGYETQLIWVTDKSHYWLIINLNGVWRHIDATPGVKHTKYSLMTDEQRYSILQGRNWDRSAWPKCE